MNLIEKLKKQVKETESKDEKKDLIVENTGMELNDDELDMAAGGETGWRQGGNLPPQ